MNQAFGFAPLPAARAIVPAVSRLAAAVREAGGGMFRIEMTHDRRCFDDWSVAYEMAAPEVRAGAPALKIPLQAGEFQKAPWSRRIVQAASSRIKYLRPEFRAATNSGIYPRNSGIFRGK